MTAEKAPGALTGSTQSLRDIIALAEKGISSDYRSQAQPTDGRPAGTRIRIYKDNLLIAKCQATGLGPGRLFVSIDPLHYSVDSRLSLEFVSTAHKGARTLLGATVTARSMDGIVLRLDPAPA